MILEATIRIGARLERHLYAASKHDQLLRHVSQRSLDDLEARVHVSTLGGKLGRLVIKPPSQFLARLAAIIANLLKELDGEVRRFHGGECIR